MKPEEILPLNAPSANFNRTFAPPPRPVEASEDKFKDRATTDKVNSPQLDHIQFNKLEASNIESQDIAQGIREVNQSLETIDGNLQQMQASLEGIVKIYPPYPPGSSERIEALRQFSAIRKMIDQIAKPGRIGSLKNILGDPARNPRSGDWKLRIGNRDSDLVIRHQPVHAGPGGLDVPEIDLESTDRQITDAIQNTSSALQTLNSKRRTFIADANRVISHIA